MSIPKMTNDLAVIQKLSDLPNSTEGLTADQLKAKFDEAPLAIQKWINEVLGPAIIASRIPFDATTEINAENVDAAIRAVHAQIKDAATGTIVNGSVTTEKLSPELLERIYGGRPWVSMDNPSSAQDTAADFPVGQIWLRPRFTVVNAAGSSWTASACTVKKTENKLTVTGSRSAVIASMTQALANIGQEGDRVYVLFQIQNKDSEITALTVSINNGDEQDAAAGVFEGALLANGSLTVKLSATWPSTSLADGSFEVVNYAVVNIDQIIRQTTDAKPIADWVTYLNGLLPLNSYVSPEEVFIHTINGNWWPMVPNVLPTERGGTGCAQYTTGQVLYVGTDGKLKPTYLTDAATMNQIPLKATGKYTGKGSAWSYDLGLEPFYIAIKNGSESVFLAQGCTDTTLGEPVWETTKVTLDGRYLRFSSTGNAAATHCNKSGTVYQYSMIY